MSRLRRVFNEASLTPWCHAVVHFEVKMSRVSACLEEDRGRGRGTP